MKTRVIVMNGQRMVQTDHAGDWQNTKIEKAGQLKPGIYNVYTATAADKSKKHEGPVVHVDKDSVVQQVGRSFVKHERAAFDKLPDFGANVAIGYAQGKAVVEGATATLGRRLSH